MILCDWEIRALCAESSMVSPFDPELVNPASLDVRLGDTLLIESAASPSMVPVDISKYTEANPYVLVPGQFVLAETIEVFNLPRTIAAQFMLKSSRARSGLEHLMAGYCDPGWNGSKLTMELHNSRQLHRIALWPDMRIGQMVFHRMNAVPIKGYDQTGRYNNQPHVQESLG